GNLEAMFDILPDIYFYVKDRECRWVLCNEASLRLLNLKSKDEIVGKTEYDFFPKKVADTIHQDDLDLIENNRSLINRTELIVDEIGHMLWVSTNKLPLYGHDGEVRGLMGTTRVLRRSDTLPDSFQQFAKAVEFIQKRYSEPIDVKELARMSGLSDSQFRRRFGQLFGAAPQQFVLKVRLQAACHLLSSSDESLSEIAQRCGFCDQSYFTRQFRGFFDISPKKYRDTWRR
ncbi:MAG: AraC family transcriptional regulator, partial [Verrucomicrobiota bacterium]